MDILDQSDRFCVVFRNYLTQSRQRENPHREIMKVLAITIGGFANSEAAPAAEDALDLSHDPLSFIHELVSPEFVIERNQQNDAESVGP